MIETPFIQPLASFTEEGISYRVLHALPEPTRFKHTHAPKLEVPESVFKTLVPDPEKNPYSQDFNDPLFDYDKFLMEMAKWANELLVFTFMPDVNKNLYADFRQPPGIADPDGAGVALDFDAGANTPFDPVFASSQSTDADPATQNGVSDPVSVSFSDPVFTRS